MPISRYVFPGLALAATSAALAAAATPYPARDSFATTIGSGTGVYKHDRGTTAIHLAPAGRGSRRTVTLHFSGLACGQRTNCLTLTGKLTGTLNAQPRHSADSGAIYKVKAAGTLKPLGHVSLTGTVTGTGFIAYGHETIRLTAKGRRGTLVVSGQSAPVRGFTSP